MLFLFAAGGVNYADRAAFASVIPPIRDELGATDVQIGVMGALFLWSYAILSPLAGTCADRFSRRTIAVGSLLLWSLVTIATGFAPNVVCLFALRSGLGVAESFYLPAAGALIADYHDSPTRGRAVSLHVLGLSMGTVAGGTFAGVLAEHIGWRWAFWTLGAIGVLLATVSPAFFTSPPTRGRDLVHEVERGSTRNAFAYLVRIRSFYAILLAAIAAGIASWNFFSWLPVYFKESYGFNLGAAGLAGVALFKAPSAIGISLGGWLSDRVARQDVRRRALLKSLSFLISAPFFLVFLGVPSFWLVAFTLVVSSIIWWVGVPSEHPILCDIVPAEFRSSAIGILNMCASAAGGLGVLLAGALKKDYGLGALFGASSLLFVIAGGVTIFAYAFLLSRDVDRARQHAATRPDERVAFAA